MGSGYQLMHARNILITYGIVGVLVGYIILECLDGETLI